MKTSVFFTLVFSYHSGFEWLFKFRIEITTIVSYNLFSFTFTKIYTISYTRFTKVNRIKKH